MEAKSSNPGFSGRCRRFLCPGTISSNKAAGPGKMSAPGPFCFWGENHQQHCWVVTGNRGQRGCDGKEILCWRTCGRRGGWSRCSCPICGAGLPAPVHVVHGFIQSRTILALLPFCLVASYSLV